MHTYLHTYLTVKNLCLTHFAMLSIANSVITRILTRMNYTDLTLTSLECWLVTGIILTWLNISSIFRLVITLMHPDVFFPIVYSLMPIVIGNKQMHYQKVQFIPLYPIMLA